MVEQVEQFLENVKIDLLRQECQGAIVEAIGNEMFVPDGMDERYEAYVADIASGAYGHTQDEVVAEYFGIAWDGESDPDKEFLWDEIDRFADKVADILNDRLNLPGDVYFGHLEADGAYGLFYALDKDDAIEEGFLEEEDE